jgi:hypothetical protein
MTQVPVGLGIDEGKTTEQLFEERAKRVDDAIHLREPDRIPVFLPFSNLLAKLGGLTQQELYEDPRKGHAALEKATLRYHPDISNGVFQTSGPSRVLGDCMTKWPGCELSANSPFQFHEGEYLKADEYDAFLADPTDWAIRVYLPRVFRELGGLVNLPHLAMSLWGYYGMAQYAADLAQPQVIKAFQALARAGEMQLEWNMQLGKSIQRMAALGFPPAPFGNGGNMAAPFDFMGDTLRGMRGIFTDMRRYPEKLLQAEEWVGRMHTQNAIARCKATGADSVAIPLHRGSDGFISLPMFERFYWPQLKKMLLELIDAGIMPFILWEGAWDQRLQYLAELPKGKILGWFQQSDIFKVKEALGDVMCIMGGMPVSMLFGSSLEQIREYTERLCKEVGKDGGFIMCTDIAEMEGCNPELVRVWVDATREFGRYEKA